MIVYAVIARAIDATILVEVFQDRDIKTNVGQVVAQLLEHLRDHADVIQDGDRKTLVHRNEGESDFFSHFIEACSAAMGDDDIVGEHYFHIYRKEDVYYCCLGDDGDSRDQKVNFAFLNHVHGEFTKLYKPQRIQYANAYGMEKNFSPNLRSAMHYHNINHKELSRDRKVQELLAQVQDFKVIMGRNINLMIENSTSLERLMQKSEEMRADAGIFKRKSTTMHRKVAIKNGFIWACLVFALIILLYLTVMGVCGAGLQACRAQTTNESNANYNNGNYNSGNYNNNGNYNSGNDDTSENNSGETSNNYNDQAVENDDQNVDNGGE